MFFFPYFFFTTLMIILKAAKPTKGDGRGGREEKGLETYCNMSRTPGMLFFY